MNCFLGPAQFALDFAAPVEGASAPLDHSDLLGAMSPPAAHEVAAVYTDGSVIALPAVGALDPESGVSFAESGRRFQVHQVLGSWRLMLRVVRFELEVVAGLFPSRSHTTRIAHHHPRSAVEPVLQVVSDLPKCRKFHPASLHRAGTRHTVAFALLSHFCHYMLQQMTSLM